MESYKIALVSDWYLPRLGGIEIHMYNLAQELVKLGYKVDIITTTKAKDVSDKNLRVIRVKLHMLPGWNAAYDFDGLGILKKILLSEKYDIVHGHSIYSTFSLGSIYVGKSLGIPTVLTNHSLLGSKIVRFIYKIAFAILKIKPNIITAVSQKVKQGTIKAIGRKDTVVLRNGIYVDKWKKYVIARSEATKQSPDNRDLNINLVSVMRLANRKSPKELIYLMNRIVNKENKKDVVLTIIGDGPLKKKLEKMSKCFKLSKNIYFSGRKTTQEINEIFSRSDIFLMPTKQEAFGISALEARAAGLPVVGMQNCGIADIIEHEKNGLLAKDYKEFALYVKKLIDNNEIRKDMSKKALEGIEYFDWKNVVKEHIEIYKKAIKQNVEEKLSFP